MAVIALASLGSCQHESKPAPKILTLHELEHYQKDCKKSKEQLEQLIYIQNIKSFGEDPDELNDEDRAYNRALKDAIWWYNYSCENQS
jgi:hypothetical protein